MNNIPIVRLVLAFIVCVEYYLRGRTELFVHASSLLLLISTVTFCANYFATRHQVKMMGR